LFYSGDFKYLAIWCSSYRDKKSYFGIKVCGNPFFIFCTKSFSIYFSRLLGSIETPFTPNLFHSMGCRGLLGFAIFSLII
jgi:hypothetical protein